MKPQVIVVLLLVGVVALVLLVRRSYYQSDHPVLNRIRENFRKLNPEYANIPLYEGNSSYTENKSTITMCLKNPENGKYYDMNTLMYVALHELGHMVSKTHGHNEEFKRNFNTLLRQAENLGIYDPQKPIPPTYCGINQ